MAIEFTQAQLDEIYAFAVDLGRKAGDLLLERIDRQIASDGETAYAYTEKDNAVDIVTQTDEDVETFIKTAIEKRYPEHKSVQSPSPLPSAY
jgi:myo-inositol-1(or 4)-monophosphatase